VKNRNRGAPLSTESKSVEEITIKRAESGVGNPLKVYPSFDVTETAARAG